MDFDTDLKPILAGMARHGATIVGTVLVGDGWLSNDKLTTFETAVAGIVMIGVAMGWSALQKWLSKSNTAAQVQAAYNQIPQPVLDQLEQIAGVIAASKNAQGIAAAVGATQPAQPTGQPTS